MGSYDYARYRKMSEAESDKFRKKSDKLYRVYSKLKQSSDFYRLEAIYYEALERGKSQDWAEGKAEGEFITITEELKKLIEDQGILRFFNMEKTGRF